MSKRTSDAILLIVLLIGLAVSAALLVFFAVQINVPEAVDEIEEEAYPIVQQMNGAPLVYDASNDPYPQTMFPEPRRHRSSRNISSTLNEGLVLYFGFDEGNGSRNFDDGSNSNRDARCLTSSCPIAGVEGKIGRALQFDGVNDFVFIDDDDSYRSERAVSIALWARWQPVASSVSTFVWKTQNDADCPDLPNCTNREYWFGIWNNSRLHLATTPNSLIGQHQISISSNYPTAPAAWHHVVAVIDADNETMRLYIDGDLVQEMRDSHLASGIRDTNGDLHIGNSLGASGAQGPFRGVMDEVRIYNRVLSDNEIRALANQ